MYYCTPTARDLTRITLETVDRQGRKTYHECVAWGPLALHLHARVGAGERLFLYGQLRYRNRKSRKGAYVSLRAYNFLGEGEIPLLNAGTKAFGAQSDGHTDQQS